ncbi:transmembrane protein 25 isoform 2-T4 [Alca torda]
MVAAVLGPPLRCMWGRTAGRAGGGGHAPGGELPAPPPSPTTSSAAPWLTQPPGRPTAPPSSSTRSGRSVAPAGGVGGRGGLLPVACVHVAGQRLTSPVRTRPTGAPGPWGGESCCQWGCPRPSCLLTARVCCPGKPQILRADARYQQVEGAGLLLPLPVPVCANPPASISWLAQDRHMMANASEILLLGATRHQGLANHSLRIHLGSAAGNFSINAANSVGVTTASLLPPGLLDARVELPLLAVAVGAALALAALLGLGSCVACLACRRAKPAPGEVRAGRSSPLRRCSHCSGSEHPQPQGARLPRQTRSLPPDLRLDDLAQEAGASTKDVGASARGEESSLSGLENALVLGKLGEGAPAGEQPQQPCCGDASLYGHPKGDGNGLPLSYRFCPAPHIRAHLQSAEREQR